MKLTVLQFLHEMGVSWLTCASGHACRAGRPGGGDTFFIIILELGLPSCKFNPWRHQCRLHLHNLLIDNRYLARARNTNRLDGFTSILAMERLDGRGTA
jgi:hypothetical protein